jgi:hypothetical protein
MMFFLSVFFCNPSRSKALKIIVSILLLTLVSELNQAYSSLVGTFDTNDIASSILGGLITYGLFCYFSDYEYTPTKGQSTGLQLLAKAFIVLIGFSAITGSICGDEGECYSNDCDDDSERCVYPVYLSMEELRADIQPELGNTATLTQPGKIYLYQDYLLIVDKYRGIHVFDNTDQQNPMRIAFLPVIGATEMSIRDAYLYTNSFMDLLSIKLEDVLDGSFNSSSVSRHEDQFERQGIYEFVPSGYRFKNSHTIPNDTGSDIVIGYLKHDDTQVLYNDVDSDLGSDGDSNE